MSLGDAILLDTFAVTVAATAMVLRGGLRHSHPGVIYLAFHVVVFSLRALAVQGGAPISLGVTSEELARALNYADLFLVCVVAGLVATPVLLSPASNSVDVSEGRGRKKLRTQWLELDNKLIAQVAIVALPIGIVTFLRNAFIPGGAAQSDSVASTAYSTLALTWPGLLLVILIYRNGFKFWLVFPMSAYLSIMAVQGFGRFRVILPAILLFQIWLDRRDRRWPRAGMIALMIAVLFVFFPLKDVGTSIKAGASYSEIRDVVTNSFTETLRGESSDQGILDQLALTLTLTDDYGQFFYGEPYLSVVTVPIPRTLWPEKPGLADHIQVISTSARPLNEVGGVTTLVGDLYLNFWLLGITAGAFALGRFAISAYRGAYSRSFLSMQRLMYLILVSSLIQIARDGLISVPVFVLLQCLPLVLIVLLHRRRVACGTRSSGHPAMRP